jgi:hypothetical protein
MIIFALAAGLIVFVILPNIKIISIFVCILFALCILGYWKILKFREVVNVKLFHRKPKDIDDEEETVEFEKPNGKKIIEATVMPLDLKKVKTEDLTEELVRRKEIKFRGQ